MGDDFDTEVLLACVLSLLNQKVDTDVILDTLVRCNGDASKAAELLNSGDQTEAAKDGQRTRKRGRGLNDWLREGSRKSAKAEAQSVPQAGPSSHTRKAPTSSSKTGSDDLMNILQQPPPSKRIIPPKPPLTLTSPSMVAKHTPCTLHLSVLPPELATRLFYAMEDASHGWKRNKWWLFERVVESPHRTSFFARRTDGIDDNASWQEAAQFW
jgi:hypothetical protein